LVNQNPTDPRPLCWFEIPVKDTLRAREFYHELFGWTYEEFTEFESDYWTISTGEGSLIGGFIKDYSDHNRTGVILFVQVENIQETIRQASKLGANIVVEESIITKYAGRHAKIMDLDGNTIGLWSK
jgi:uncharacterized protein